MAPKTKVLIAVDGSENAMDAVRYAGQFFDPERTDMTLIHIMAELPDMVDDLKTIASIDPAALETDAWHQKMAEQTRQMMAAAESILIGIGYEKASIHIIIRTRENGVAKDITAECGKDYDALILGRRGAMIPPTSLWGPRHIE